MLTGGGGGMAHCICHAYREGGGSNLICFAYILYVQPNTAEVCALDSVFEP